ncbi:MAG: peptide deformylase [Firmicutes bacterium]|nr:peptide deformylase [Bacillota bacterium]
MALRKIVTEGDPILTKRCREVPQVTDRVRQLIDDMVETMHDAEGIGLAAPQVGVLRRIIVVDVFDGNTYELINPEIVEQEGEQYEEEGCLSVPGLVGLVHRPAYVKVKGLDRNGEPVEYEGTDLLARAFCHEIDHLEGTLFNSKADDLHYPTEDEEEEAE